MADVLQQVNVEEVSPRNGSGAVPPAPVDAPQPPTTDQKRVLDEAGNGASPAAPKRKRLADIVIHPVQPPQYPDDDPLIPKCPSCRADLCYYTLEEQDVIACQNLDCLYFYINNEIYDQVAIDLNKETSQTMRELIRRAAREIETYYSHKSNLRKRIKAVKSYLKRERDGQA